MKTFKKILKFFFYLYTGALVLYWLFKDTSDPKSVIMFIVSITAFMIVMTICIYTVKYIIRGVTKTVKDEWKSDKK